MASAVSSVLLTPLPAAVRVGTMMEGWGILDEVPPQKIPIHAFWRVPDLLRSAPHYVFGRELSENIKTTWLFKGGS